VPTGCFGGSGTADMQHLALGVARHAHQRVNNPVRRAVAPVDGHGHRVDQEGHVVVDNLHHRVIADKTVFSQCRVKHPDLGRVGGAGHVQQTPVGIGDGKQAGRATCLQFVGVGVVEIGAYKIGKAAGGRACVFLGIGQQLCEHGMGHCWLRIVLLDVADSRLAQGFWIRLARPIHGLMQESHYFAVWLWRRATRYHRSLAYSSRSRPCHFNLRPD
jgi:hypothetical protein